MKLYSCRSVCDSLADARCYLLFSIFLLNSVIIIYVGKTAPERFGSLNPSISARGPDVAADEAYPYDVELTRRVREEPSNGKKFSKQDEILPYRTSALRRKGLDDEQGSEISLKFYLDLVYSDSQSKVS